MTDFAPRNILLVHFGQMGDVILALPALCAVRARFPDAKITSMTGKSAAAIARIAGVFDDEIVVDRVELRDGNKLKSIAAIRRLTRDVRARKFDFIVDLHSLSETNILGFLSGAKSRLYAHRENRSLDFLGRFAERPPREDKSLHITDRYLDVLKPLGIESAPRFVEIAPKPEDLAHVDALLAEADVPLLGIFPGAGHPSRKWPLENFAELSRRFESARTVVFLGPEETGMRVEVERLFGERAIILDKLTIPQLLAATSRLRVLVSNDTGVVHIGAISGTNLVLVLDERAPSTFLPLSPNLAVVNNGTIDAIAVDDVFAAAAQFLNA